MRMSLTDESDPMKNIFGLGLRPPFYKEAAAGEIAVDWFEVITENFMVDGGNPLRISDHLCWTRHGGHHLHDLLPLPYRKDVIEHVARRVSGTGSTFQVVGKFLTDVIR